MNNSNKILYKKKIFFLIYLKLATKFKIKKIIHTFFTKNVSKLSSTIFNHIRHIAAFQILQLYDVSFQLQFQYLPPYSVSMHGVRNTHPQKRVVCDT